MHRSVRIIVQTTATALGLAAVLVPAIAQKAADKLPATFVCKHCKIKMTVKSQADWKKKCWVCPCKTTAAACKPAPKK